MVSIKHQNMSIPLGRRTKRAWGSFLAQARTANARGRSDRRPMPHQYEPYFSPRRSKWLVCFSIWGLTAACSCSYTTDSNLPLQHRIQPWRAVKLA
ncbi:hypothetical protein BS50DRAFT_53555 [Corynespora cassiicola Philippines]|uniref:Uncharacterized protein n=1 Tax=Corynespora cassiicola Philippines TaxID=1448308 RepID=A0A2T2NIF0_CORCC|nr:hypothetical protein BS50DRAFT_53555 [Corynespora cassiicola Philippines]